MKAQMRMNRSGSRRVERMCVICRQRFDQRDLARYVVNPMGALVLDARKVMPGRGFYCCGAAGCELKFAGFKPRKCGKKARGQGEK